MEQKTPLYPQHMQAQGRMVEFAGYLLPVQYPAGVLAEHKAVRSSAGMFDVSHMGEVMVHGPDALENLNRILTNDFTSLPVGACRYSLMLYPNGGQVDDLIVYRLNSQQFMLVLNAANTQKDITWLRSHLQGDCTLEDISAATAQIAVQGPRAQTVLESLCDAAQLPQAYYTFTQTMQVAHVPCLVSRTGYTGEDGFELYLAPAQAAQVWEALLQAGVQPCGLGCRDTLRLEAGMPLYGHELGEAVNPLGAGLNFAISMGKEDFIGKQALLAMQPAPQKRVGLTVTGRGIVREGEDIYAGETKVGVTTSGTYCPWLEGAYALAYVDTAYSAPGTALEVKVRGRGISAQVVPLPFYRRAAPAR